MSGKKVPFHGILAIGGTQQDAVNRYTLLAQGKGVRAMVDKAGKFSFVTHASSKVPELFNPVTGKQDLKKEPSLVKDMDFESNSSAGTKRDVEYYVCHSGCGLHFVYDSPALMQKCPCCTLSVSGDSDDEDDEDYDEESDVEDEEIDPEDEEDSEEDEPEEDEEDAEDEEIVIAADSVKKARSIYRAQKIAAGANGVATASSAEVEYLVCSSAECNAHVLSEKPINECPACTAPLNQPTPEQVSMSGDDDEEEEEDDDLSVVDEDEDDEAEDDEESDDESESSDATPETSAPAVAAPPAATETTPPAAAVADAQTGANPAVPAVTETAEKIVVNMLSQIPVTDEAHKGLDLSFSGSISGKEMWTAYYEGNPVATARVENAGKNADVFNDPAFGRAVLASAKHCGVASTLKEMGFVGISHEISISNLVSRQVNEQVATASSALEQDRAEYPERLQAALATAAIGINRGFFPDIKNPLKESLWNALSAAGIQTPEVLIDNVFKAAADKYHSTLFAVAQDLISKPQEVQNGLAKAIMGTNYMSVSSGATPDSSLEQRLENFGTVTASAQPIPQKQAINHDDEESVSSDQKMSSVVAGLGRRFG